MAMAESNAYSRRSYGEMRALPYLYLTRSICMPPRPNPPCLADSVEEV